MVDYLFLIAISGLSVVVFAFWLFVLWALFVGQLDK